MLIAALTSLSAPHPQDLNRWGSDMPGWFRKRRVQRQGLRTAGPQPGKPFHADQAVAVMQADHAVVRAGHVDGDIAAD